MKQSEVTIGGEYAYASSDWTSRQKVVIESRRRIPGRYGSNATSVWVVRDTKGRVFEARGAEIRSTWADEEKARADRAEVQRMSTLYRYERRQMQAPKVRLVNDALRAAGLVDEPQFVRHNASASMEDEVLPHLAALGFNVFYDDDQFARPRILLTSQGLADAVSSGGNNVEVPLDALVNLAQIVKES